MKDLIHRKDIKPLEYHIHHVDLTFDLDKKETLVTSQLHIKRTQDGLMGTPLTLQGERLEFVAIEMDGRLLQPTEYEVTDKGLTVFLMSESCLLTIKNKIHPEANKGCSGLYRSDHLFTTQCEAESFRKITYYQDRPDNLATFKTTVIHNLLKRLFISQ